ncbi:DUF1573 domain-containing protein [uncultured Muribaculum sp.]|uniref:DUF1573 domain-containing protein n=1 Tax=uncultured Muribaculum sp. TaxID=1918613 RepID=UPI0025FA7193|nr:DUF1573 domain-containing protein [uncultured Muribaculum sp.]
MNHIYKLLLLPTAIFAVTASTAIGQTVNGSVTFAEKIHDFGEIAETGGKVTHRFTFTNTGRDTVLLTNARAGCSCVQAKVSTRPVYPGKTGHVDVTFDPDFRPGHFSKEVVVISNGKKYNRIWVKGDVIPGKHPIPELYPYDYGRGLYMNYKVLNFGGVPQGGSKTHTLKFGNSSDNTLNIAFKVDAESPGTLPFALTVPDRYLLKPGEEGSVPISVKVITPIAETVSVTVTPEANGYPLQPLTVTVMPQRRDSFLP